jgi:ATP adenylyltransferase
VPEWKPLDRGALPRREQTKCFICELVEEADPHELFYEDEVSIAFFPRFPVLVGYALVAPREHREQVTGNFALQEYLDLQRVVYRVSEALRALLHPERVYILSLGSQQANAHVHWHIAPLPPGVPSEQQQFHALTLDGYFELSDAERADLSQELRARMLPP